MLRKKGSKILKLLPVRNCFTLAMTNKLVVIINSLKVPKIKKMLLYEMKFFVPNYSCLQNPWLGGHRPQIPFLSVLCPQLNLLKPPPRTKFLGTPLLLSTVTLKAFHTAVQELQSYNQVMLLNRFRSTTSVQPCCLHLLLNSQLCTHIQYSHTTLFGTQDLLQLGTLRYLSERAWKRY